MLDLHRDRFKRLEASAAKVFAVLALTPNQYTSLSIAAILGCDYFLFSANYWCALALFALAAGLDFVDGAVARAKNLATKKGAYWDTIADRYVEAIILFGLLFVNLPDFYLPSYAWIFLALFGSTMTTYAKSAAFEKGLSQTELKGGLLSRGERILFLAAVLIALNFDVSWAVYILVLLAVLTNITALQRIAAALRR